MKIRIIGCVVGLGVALGLTTASCEQPENDCAASRRPFAARFTLTSGDDTCRMFGPYTGDIIGVQTYNPANAERTEPDLSTSFIAVKALNLQAIYHGFLAASYGVIDPQHELADDPATQPTRFAYALGDFVDTLPESEVCSVPSFRQAAEYQTTEEVPPFECPVGGAGGMGGGGAGGAAGGMGGMVECVPDPGLPKLDIKYEWSAFRMIERSDAPGTVFEATLRFAETTECSAEYRVIAIAPQVDCGLYDPTTGEPVVDAEGNQEPDPAHCLPEANVDEGRPVGSGLNPALFESGTAVSANDLVQCVGPDPVLGWQCALVVNSIDEVISKLDASE